MTPWVKRLLIANVLVFFVQATEAMPQLTSALVLVPAYVLQRPWTIVTYMFLHGGYGHIIFNMIALFFFGPRVEARLGSSRFAILYFLSGITGALLSLLPFTNPLAHIVGASGAVYGVMLAFAYYWPRDLIYIWGVLPIQAAWLVVITTLISLFGGFSGGGGGVAHFAHLGGYVGAYLYLRWIGHGRTQFRQKAAAAPKTTDPQLANWRNVKAEGVHELTREELNRILDKINSQGLGSLTPDERRFLSNFVPADDRVPPVS